MLVEKLVAPLRTLLEAPLGPSGREVVQSLVAGGFSGTVMDFLRSPDAVALMRQVPGARKEIHRAVGEILDAFVEDRDPRELPADLTEPRLRDWARQRAVDGFLDRPAAGLWGIGLERLGVGSAWNPTLLDLLLQRTPALPRQGLRELPRVHAAARAFLQRAVGRVRAAVDEEERWEAERAVPEEAEARLLWDRVYPVRQTLRRELGAPSLLSGERIVLREDPPQIEYGGLVVVGLAGAGHVQPTCRCAQGLRGLCGHVLAALDAILRLLSSPATGKTGRARDELVALATHQPWKRLLAELDAGFGVSASPLPPLTWRLARAPGQAHGLILGALVGDKRGKTLSLHELWVRRGHLASPVDVAVCEALLPDPDSSHNQGRYQPAAYVHRALRLLVGDPRVWLPRGPRRVPIQVTLGRMTIEGRDRPGGGMALEPCLDGVPVADLGRLLGQIAAGLLVELDEEAARCRVTPLSPEVITLCGLLRRRGTELPAAAESALAERLPVLLRALPLSAPPRLLGLEVPAAPTVVLRLTRAAEGLLVEALVRALPGAPAHPPGLGPAQVLHEADGQRVFARRELDGEAAWLADRLAGLPLPGSDGDAPNRWTLTGTDESLALLAALADRPEAFQLEWPVGGARRVTRTASREDLRVAITDRRDWFGLEGGLTVEGHVVPLAVLLAAMRARQRFVPVGPDAFMRLSDELRAQLGPVADVVFAGRGGALEVSPLAASLLEDVIDLTADETAVTKRFRETLARLRSAADAPPPTPPVLGGGVVLRDYQVAGFQWLSRLAAWGLGGCLADDMGLGKTLQALALLIERAPAGPALVLAPTSVCWNWVRELERCAPGRLRAVVYRDSDRDSVLDALGPGDVLVATYGLLARHAEALAARRFTTLVLDEAQALKNAGTDRARAAAALQADFRLALSGTPVENRLAELWSLFRNMAPGLLGSWEQFRGRFAAPIEKDGDPERRAALARLVRPFMLRRLKADVARELPTRTEVRVDVDLAPEERRRYDQLRRAVFADLREPRGARGGAGAGAGAGAQEGQRRFQILAALTRLRQLACDPRLVDGDAGAPSSKLARMVELTTELVAEGHRALVFSQFTSLLALARTALEAEGMKTLYLDGKTPERTRRALVDSFQAGEGQVFLISLTAGGTGLNLTGADNVIHLDPWWNPAVEDQASDRAHRIGQTRPVTVYKLVSSGTVEEQILALHAEKRALVAGILDGTGTAPALSTDELLALLGEPPPAARRSRSKRADAAPA